MSDGLVPRTSPFALYQEIQRLKNQITVLKNSIALVAAASQSQSRLFSGSGSPEGVTTAQPGSIYIDLATPAEPKMYIKQTGTGNTGWA